MEYNRLIAYIYSYNNGMKSRNTGFAKIENRQNTLKMQINLKDAYTDNLGMWKVFLFYRRERKIVGINVGEMHLANGTGEFHYCGNGHNIENSGISFGDIKGLYIALDNDTDKIFASEWDDLGFNIDRITEKTEEHSVKIEFEDIPDVIPDVKDDEPELVAAETDDSVQESDGDSDDRNKFDAIIKGRDKKYIFADDDLYDIVEITPDDIEKMPDTNWALKNNSFVNHGYFNFRHLIMGKVYNPDKCGYFIGVPGVYTRRDRNTAAMFGFNRFKFSMRSDVGLGQFGYWYMELNCQ